MVDGAAFKVGANRSPLDFDELSRVAASRRKSVGSFAKPQAAV
jgi:hypothetical protein